ncbi:hypothetical protein E3983_05175 [Legionella israelensis]|uniref:Uncharacterized protein n=1 Tax=Legionella israelensis TaxID=454 RepID=A0AAX1EFB0_9GAMM|nr:hypothetical protein [Legionella israelensis]QBR83795.1 hypothetical protein E3983_05175 [Legionella israelensis]
MPLLNELLRPEPFLLFWLIYALICLPLTYAMLFILPRHLQKQNKANFIFLYFFCVSILVLGLLIALILVVGLRLKKLPPKKRSNFASLQTPAFQQAPAEESIAFGEASAFELIQTKKTSKTKKQKLLVAISQYNTGYVSRINRLALSDEVDEVRLYAQCLIEKKERKLSNSVKRLHIQLQKTKNRQKAAFYQKQLAEIMWEQIYQFLVGNGTFVATLKKIEEYAHEAFDVLKDDMELPLLLAKVALRNSKLDEAKNWLLNAKQNQAPEYKVRSLLAEIDYHKRNYQAVKDQLKYCRNPGIIGLQPVTAFWE